MNIRRRITDLMLQAEDLEKVHATGFELEDVKISFSHDIKVSVAGIECQTCHGPVEEMEIMSQYSPLTMGWCINCHRETNVNIADNEYYASIHEELTKKYGVEKLTAAQMGGLECGKCHY